MEVKVRDSYTVENSGTGDSSEEQVAMRWGMVRS